ncbi:MAG TPA: T9SS type B sorting domain-containing protein, partial [Chitinophagaceae bacterium]|nr:T9SS type B sorting domain-containing protein [Chitinophagaceae bacterium]
NASTGVIDLAASTPATYTITYSFGTAPCNGTATSSVTVSSSPTATVSGGTFCATGTTTLTTTGATGGTFSAFPAGLSINASTGVIDLAASTPATYTITYSFGTAPCNGTATSSVTVNSQPTAPVLAAVQPTCALPTGTITVTAVAGLEYQLDNGSFGPYPAGGWSGLAPGSHIVTVRNPANNTCTSNASITINAVPNVNITATPIVTNTMCSASIGAINITVSGGTSPYTYLWSNGAITEDISGLAAGTYTVTITDANGCSTTSTSTIIAIGVPITVTPVVTNTMCTASIGAINITVSGGTSPYTYLWSNGATTEDITGLNAGTYTVTITDANGCTTTLPFSVAANSVTILATPVVTNTTCTASVGAINLIVSGGTSPYTYLWNNGVTTPNITGLAAGNYTVTITDANGCTSNIPFTVGTNIVPVTTNVDTVLCANLLPFTWNNINVNAAGLYQFITQNGLGCDSIIKLNVTVRLVTRSITRDSTCANQPYTWNGNTYTTSGTYSDTLINAAGCDSIATLVLLVKPIPTVVINDPPPVCEPLTINLTAASITAGSDPGLIYTYWRDSLATIPLTNPNAIGTSGTYYIKAEGGNSCTSTKPVAVIVRIIKLVAGVRYPTVTTGPNTPTQLSARNIGLSYAWSPPVGLSSPFIREPIFNYNNQTEYLINITRDNGCITVDTVLVKIIAVPPSTVKSDLFVPKAWTPNNDGHNDKLFPLTVNIRELKYFRVFNRWGQLVFETNAIGQGWDGVFQGKPAVMDVYTWTVEAIGVDGKYIKKSGNSVLIR